MLYENLLKYRKAVAISSPGLPPRLPWESNSESRNPFAVRVDKKDGGFLNAVFCDVFAMENAKIKRLTTYFVEVK
jgi:hypothetical protein